MEVSFDTEKHNGAGAPVTRIYAPSHRNGPEVRMIEEAAENLPVYPQPREKDLEAEQKENSRSACCKLRALEKLDGGIGTGKNTYREGRA